eukprot:6213730-Pleurochrysis_carterae.AAC.4
MATRAGAPVIQRPRLSDLSVVAQVQDIHSYAGFAHMLQRCINAALFAQQLTCHELYAWADENGMQLNVIPATNLQYILRKLADKRVIMVASACLPARA